MIITVIGTGYVGLVTGACLAELGFDVNCIDKNPAIVERLNAGQATIHEDGLEAILGRARRNGTIRFHSEYAEAIAAADMIFLAVGTPTRPGSDEADLSYLDAALAELAPHLHEGQTVVVKSTVPVGTNDRLQAMLDARRPGLDVSLASNPEFLREGSAVKDFFGADRIVAGVRDERSRAHFIALYRPLVEQGAPLVFTTPANAELAKYASNAFLALKIAYINEIADFCEVTGADVEHVSTLMGMDSRIGAAFLKAGPGYGGSCFPKDTLALLASARRHGVAARLVETTVAANDERKERLVERVLASLGAEVMGKRVAVLGIAFKANTDDVRQSTALSMIPMLQAAGVTVHAHDPLGRKNAERELTDVTWFDDALAALRDVDAAVILTDWPEYAALRPEEIALALAGAPLHDLRNLLTAETGRRASPAYRGIGRGAEAVPPLSVVTAAALADEWPTVTAFTRSSSSAALRIVAGE